MSRQQALFDSQSAKLSENPLFRIIEITERNNIDFRYGLPGFEILTRFLIADVKGYAPFRVLQSLEEPNISLLMLDIKLIKTPGYLKIPQNDFNKIKVTNGDHETKTEIYVIVRYDKASMALTANIRAPIIINRKDRIGYQAILDNNKLSIHYPLMPV